MWKSAKKTTDEENNLMKSSQHVFVSFDYPVSQNPNLKTVLFAQSAVNSLVSMFHSFSICFTLHPHPHNHVEHD